MSRYYLLSTLIHIILFVLFIASAVNDQAHQPKTENNISVNKDDAAALDKMIKEILEKDIDVRQQKLKDIAEMVQKYRPELNNKKIKSFSEMIISSQLENIDLAEIAEDNLANRSKDYSKQETEALKVEISSYLSPGKQGSSNSDSNESEGLVKGASGNGHLSDSESSEGAGGIAENVQGDINYNGTEVPGSMPPHSVSSGDNPELKARNLEDLQVAEDVTRLKQQAKLVDIIDQKPSKYALLPEDPFEFIETGEQSQDTVFESRRIGYAAHMNDDFIADGILNEWDLSRPMIPLNIKNKRLFSANIYLAWDLENIYLAAEVIDRNPIIKNSNWWMTNSVEVWFDILNNKQFQAFDGDDFQFWFAPFSPFFGKALGSHRFLGRSIPNYVRKNATGYTVEAVFNQNEELRYLRSYLGKTIGFHFFVNTSSSAPDGYEDRLFWITDKYLPGNVHTYTWNNPNSWGDVVFMGSAAKIKLENKIGSAEYNHFGINEWNYITVYDGDRNLDPKTRQFLKVIVRSKSSNDLEELVLTESGPNSSRFVAALFSSTEPAMENDGYLQTTAGSPVKIYYNDQYTATGHSRLLTKTYFTYYPIMLLSAE